MVEIRGRTAIRRSERRRALLADESWEEAKKNRDAMRVDPEFQEIVKSEEAEETLEGADVTYMRQTDSSPLK